MFAKKMGLIILIGVGVASFVASFGLSYVFGKKPDTPAGKQPVGAAVKDRSVVGKLSDDTFRKLNPSQEQMRELIAKLRSEKAEYQNRFRKLEEREKRLRIARDMLAKEAKDIEELRDKLVAPLLRLKELSAELEKSRVLIGTEERKNIKKTAAIYEKMDPTEGARIMENMCMNNQDDDVVRILYYMSERSAAQLLATMKTEGLAARLCDKLKRVREKGK